MQRDAPVHFPLRFMSMGTQNSLKPRIAAPLVDAKVCLFIFNVFLICCHVFSFGIFSSSVVVESTKKAGEAGKGSDGESVWVSARLRGAEWWVPGRALQRGPPRPSQSRFSVASAGTEAPSVCWYFYQTSTCWHWWRRVWVCVFHANTHTVRCYHQRATSLSPVADWTFSLITSTHLDSYSTLRCSS